MTRYLLDTNILSHLVRPVPGTALIAWMGNQADADLFISALTVAEIRRGILDLPAGRRRDGLDAWFSGSEGPQALFASRILPFDAEAGLAWAALMAEGRRQGRPRSALDMVIAATAQVHACLVVTENERDFAGLPYLNPVRDSDIEPPDR